MEVNLNPDLQARLAHLAAQEGRDERLVDYDDWFIREVDKSLSQLEQGKVLTHEQVGARIEGLMTQKQSRAQTELRWTEAAA